MILAHDEDGSLSHLRLSRISDMTIERERVSNILTKKTDHLDLEANWTAIGLPISPSLHLNELNSIEIGIKRLEFGMGTTTAKL